MAVSVQLIAMSTRERANYAVGNVGRTIHLNVASLSVYLEIGDQMISSVGASLILGHARRGESLGRKRVAHVGRGSRMLSNQPQFTWVCICPHPTLERLFSPRTLWILMLRLWSDNICGPSR